MFAFGRSNRFRPLPFVIPLGCLSIILFTTALSPETQFHLSVTFKSVDIVMLLIVSSLSKIIFDILHLFMNSHRLLVYVWKLIQQGLLPQQNNGKYAKSLIIFCKRYV